MHKRMQERSRIESERQMLYDTFERSFGAIEAVTFIEQQKLTELGIRDREEMMEKFVSTTRWSRQIVEDAL